MGYPIKIATCCFCGSKAALTLEKGRHELSCAQCGAPLHDLKQLPQPASAESAQPALQDFAVQGPKKGAYHKWTAPRPVAKQKTKPWPKTSKKRRSGWLKKLGSEIFDVVEDIFD